MSSYSINTLSVQLTHAICQLMTPMALHTMILVNSLITKHLCQLHETLLHFCSLRTFNYFESKPDIKSNISKIKKCEDL